MKKKCPFYWGEWKIHKALPRKSEQSSSEHKKLRLTKRHVWNTPKHEHSISKYELQVPFKIQNWHYINKYPRKFRFVSSISSSYRVCWHLKTHERRLTKRPVWKTPRHQLIINENELQFPFKLQNRHYINEYPRKFCFVSSISSSYRVCWHLKTHERRLAKCPIWKTPKHELMINEHELRFLFKLRNWHYINEYPRKFCFVSSISSSYRVCWHLKTQLMHNAMKQFSKRKISG